ncbi:MAG: polysaccharide biosynthesis/export family protein [Tannerella sp.]|nr:polysaccharide biosynthesis/export family protein [Tannerella sp.]
MRHIFLWSIGLILMSGACSVPKDITYFQGIDDITDKQREMMNQSYNANICEDDLLTINVSSWDPTLTIPYNPPAYSYYEPNQQQVNTNTVQNLFTYLVDKEGYIDFPVIGRVHLEGLSIHEANSKLQELIKPAVPDVLVNVQIVNFKVGIYGEVARSNIYTIRNNRISVLDLIVLAGDLTINANRKNLLLIRDNNGEKVYARLNMTDPNIFASPYFYLKQNDIIYVEPNDAKKRNANYSSAQQYTLTIISTIMTGVSVVSTIILAVSKR